MEGDAVQGARHRALPWVSSSQATPRGQCAPRLDWCCQGQTYHSRPEDPVLIHLPTIAALQDLMSLLFFPRY